MANDAVQLLEALNVGRAVVVGHDWDARIGYTMAALWPERVERLIVMSVPYESGIKSGAKINYRQQQAFWYQWFFGSERGQEALQDNRRQLCRYLWQSWSTTWNFTEEQFATTAKSWDDPDWVEVTLHSYRVRWGNGPADPHYQALESRLNEHPIIKVPTIHLHGQMDGVNLADCLEDPSKSFSAGYERRLLPGVGHFIPRECPETVVNSVLIDD
jgi:pimeloyl-ACP methyl ester carboxylesterase